MSATRTYKISSVGIDTKAFAQRFCRDPHPIGGLIDQSGDLLDKNKSYFNENERLTAAEISEIEDWPDTVNELFDSKGSKGARDHFLRCLREAVEPETSTERIVNKLIHQALAMGGLHCHLGENESAKPQIPSDQPSNDILDLKALPLRLFLEEVKKEMSKNRRKEWQEAIWQLAHEENLSLSREYELWDDLEGAYRDAQDAEVEYRKELYSDADGYANSGEEGWFYDDED